MSDETKTNIHDLIKKDIEPAANALIKEQKEGIGKLAKIMLDLGKAIDKPDVRMVKLLSKALDAESPLIANRLSRTGKLLQRLEDAESETDLDNDLKELEEITTKLSELEKAGKQLHRPQGIPGQSQQGPRPSSRCRGRCRRSVGRA